MRYAIIGIALFILGCGLADTPAPKGGGAKADDGKPLTADERERWEKARKKYGSGSFAIIALVRGEWQTHCIDMEGDSRWRNDIPGGLSEFSLKEAREQAKKYASEPSIDCVAVVDFYSGPDPKIVHLTRERGADRKGVAAYLLKLQKDVGR